VKAFKDSGSRKIEEILEEVPRVRLAFLPTPLEKAEGLTSLLGGPNIFIKRDDCCLLYTSPSPRDATLSRMPSSA